MEQRDVNLGSREDNSPEGVEGKRQESVEGVEETSEWFGTAEAGDPTIDWGLRRRFVTDPSDPLGRPTTSVVTPKAMESASDDSSEAYNDRGCGNYEMKHLGSFSRRILEPEKPNLYQPPKKKKKNPWGFPTVPTPERDARLQTKKPFKVKIRELWTTGDEFKVPLVDSYPMYALRDFVVYLTFMTVVCIIAFGGQGSAYNYYSDVIRSLLTSSSYNSTLGNEVSFLDTSNRHDIWAFIINVLLKVLYDQPYTMGRETLLTSGIRNHPENIFFGVPQLRQLRVRGMTCTPAPMFQDVFGDCADYYSEEIEDKEAFGLKTTAWTYSPPPEEQSYYRGRLSTYPEGGFTMNFSTWENFTLNYILELRDDDWIRFGTRAVFVDFVLFNPNTHLFCVCKLLFELPPFGGVVPSYQFSTLKLLKYVEPWDFFILACKLVFTCFIIYYTLEELTQIIRLRESYWSNWWNILDIIILIASYCAIALGIVSLATTRNFSIRNIENIHTQNHVSFDYVADVQFRYEVSMAFVVIIVWMKILKFSTLSRYASLILDGILRTGPATAVSVIISGVVMMGFAIFGNVVFGSRISSFKTADESFTTVLRLVSGGLHWRNDISDHGVHYWVIFYSVTSFLLLRVIMLNVYVALIIFGIHEEVREINELSNTATLGDFFREVLCQFLTFIGKHRLVYHIYDREIIKQNIRIYEALAGIIRRHGYHSMETDLILEKYGVTYGRPITKETMSALYDDIHVRNILSLEVENHNKLREHIEQIDKNILVIDQTLMGIMTKVDILTNRYIMKRTIRSPPT